MYPCCLDLALWHGAAAAEAVCGPSVLSPGTLRTAQLAAAHLEPQLCEGVGNTTSFVRGRLLEAQGVRLMRSAWAKAQHGGSSTAAAEWDTPQALRVFTQIGWMQQSDLETADFDVLKFLVELKAFIFGDDLSPWIDRVYGVIPQLDDARMMWGLAASMSHRSLQDYHAVVTQPEAARACRNISDWWQLGGPLGWQLSDLGRECQRLVAEVAPDAIATDAKYGLSATASAAAASSSGRRPKKQHSADRMRAIVDDYITASDLRRFAGRRSNNDMASTARLVQLFEALYSLLLFVVKVAAWSPLLAVIAWLVWRPDVFVFWKRPDFDLGWPPSFSAYKRQVRLHKALAKMPTAPPAGSGGRAASSSSSNNAGYGIQKGVMGGLGELTQRRSSAVISAAAASTGVQKLAAQATVRSWVAHLVRHFWRPRARFAASSYRRLLLFV